MRHPGGVRSSARALALSAVPPLACGYAIDSHHTRGNQVVEALGKADIGENAIGVRTGFGSRPPDVHGGSRQPGRRAAGRHEPNIVMLSGGTQLVFDHPWVLHEFGKIEDTTVRAEASRDATRDPMVDGMGAEEGFERPL